MKSKAFALAFAAGLIATAVPLGLARAAEVEIPLPHVNWSFDGVFGTFDRAQLKRGWNVFHNVCSSCHSADQLYYRDLTQIGLTEAEVKEIAASAQISGGVDDNGDPVDRPGKPSDHIKPPFPNVQAARAANGGALPPDLSLIVKARKGGADYVHAILTGFKAPPASFKLQAGMNYNEYFAGHQIAMPPPLTEDAVTYEDGTKATVDQEAQDVVTFLTWASEPTMEQRKRLGIKVLAFLLVLTALLYGVKRKVWADVH